MPVTTLNAIAQSSAERLVNSALEGLVLALLAWLVLRLVPRQNAGTRFSIWMATLLSIAFLPVAETLARVNGSTTSPVALAPVMVPAAWGVALFALWACISLLLMARVGLGLLQLRNLRNSAEGVEPASLGPLARQTLLDSQAQRAVKLCVSDSVSVPTAVGLFRPAVLVPRWALSELSADDLNSVLVHELAHLRRRDDWTNLLQKVVRAIFFFHPAVWWIENRLSLEREMACDEHVLATQANPRAYAECLVSLAERGFLHRAVAMAQGAVSRVRECSARVAQILSGGRPQAAQASRLVLLGAASGSVLLLATFAQAPNLVAFGSPAPAYMQANAGLAHGLPYANNKAIVTPAAWHPQRQAVPRGTPAMYVPEQASTREQSNIETAAANSSSEKATPTSVRKPAVQPGLETMQSAPGLYRAGFKESQAAAHNYAVHNVGLHSYAAHNGALPGQLVIIQQTAFYTNGSEVWAVSIYRMAVLKPQPATPNDISRKAI